MSKAPNITTVTLPTGPMPELIGWTVWPAPTPTQPHVAHGGGVHTGTWGDHCRWVEAQHAGRVYAKGRSPHYAMVETTDGHRCNASVRAVAAVHYDYDDGEHGWDVLLAALDRAGIAYIAYQSGGHRDDHPKWHVTIPLALPYVPSAVGHDAAGTWRRMYHAGRWVVGHLAGLGSGEMDRAPCAMSSAVYPGYRRSPDVPVREVRWSDGLALDGAAVLAAAGTPTARMGTATTADPFRTLSLATTRAPAGGQYAQETLPGDTQIICVDGGVRRSVALQNVSRHSHCVCPAPEHGGVWRDAEWHGSAWVDVGRDGVPRVHCGPCQTTWSAGGTSEEQEAGGVALAALLAEDLPTMRTVPAPAAPSPGPTAPSPAPKVEWPDLAEACQRAVEWASPLAECIRASQPRLTRRRGCGGLPQGLRDRKTGEGLHIGRGCGRDDCAWCAPYRHAMRAGAVLYTPPTIDGQVVGLPLIDRGAWVYRVPVADVPMWRQAWKRQQNGASLRALIASDPKCGNALGDALPHFGSFNPQGLDILAVFDPVGSTHVTLLSTCPIRRRTRRGEQVEAVFLAGDELAREVGDRAHACYVVRDDDAITGIRRVVVRQHDTGRIKASIAATRELSIRPETTRARANPDAQWGLERTDLCPPGLGARRLVARGEAPQGIYIDGDGLTSAVRLAPRTDEEWAETWGLLGRGHTAEDLPHAASAGARAATARALSATTAPIIVEHADEEAIGGAIVAAIDDPALTPADRALLRRLLRRYGAPGVPEDRVAVAQAIGT